MMRVFGIGLIVILLSVACATNDSGSSNNNNNTETSTDTSEASANNTSTDNLPLGERLYSQPMESGNTFACQTCHALTEPAADGIRRPGHALENVTRRSSYKDQQLTSMLDAVNTCLTDWMRADTWSADDPNWLALFEWLDEKATVTTAEPVDIQIVEAPEDLTGGDSTQGQTLFNQSCSICHAQEGVGSEKAPRVTGIGFTEDYIARRVRTSGSTSSIYEGLTGGVMPFWGADRLSDDELRDLIAYLNDVDNHVDATNTSTNTSTSNTNNNSNSQCGSDHARVGQILTFSTLFHDVEGKAEVIDNCTIQISEFYYDGRGIDVRIYTGNQGNYTRGTAISEDLFTNGTPYQNQTLTLTLPDSISLDDFDGLSVWCVDAAISFGDGLFQDP